jgi:fatty acid desaturase
LTLAGMVAANVTAFKLLPVLCWITVPVAAFAMACALSVVHECGHSTYLSSRRANRWLGRGWALIILMNFSLYRQQHARHHAHIGTDGDTEPTIRLRGWRDLASAVIANDHAIQHWGISLSAMNPRHAAPRTVRLDAITLTVMAILLVGATVVAPTVLIVGFWVPLALSLFIDNFISVPEHAQLNETAGSPVMRNMMAGSVASFLLYHVNRHRDHHEKPTVSVRLLPTSGAPVSATSTYWGFFRAAIARVV